MAAVIVEKSYPFRGMQEQGEKQEEVRDEIYPFFKVDLL